MRYAIRLENGGQIHVNTGDGDVEMIWSSFDEFIKKRKQMSERVLNEACRPETFEVMHQHERLKNFFVRIKDAEPENYKQVLDILKKQDPGFFDLIKGV